MMEEVLDDSGVLKYISIGITKHRSLDAQQLTHWRKDTAEARRMIFEGVRLQISIEGIHHSECRRTLMTCWKKQ